MPATTPIAKEPKTTSDRRARATLANSARTLAGRKVTQSNGRVGAAVAGRKLSGAMKTRGGSV